VTRRELSDHFASLLFDYAAAVLLKLKAAQSETESKALIEEAEETTEFKLLAAAVYAACGSPKPLAGGAIYDAYGTDFRFYDYLRTFFDRTGVYEKLLASEQEISSLAAPLADAVDLQKNQTVTTVLPLLYTAFDRDRIDFDGFSIVRYPLETIKRLLRTDGDPSSDSGLLSEMWCLEVKSQAPHPVRQDSDDVEQTIRMDFEVARALRGQDPVPLCLILK
jgi:hypothetical protein